MSAALPALPARRPHLLETVHPYRVNHPGVEAEYHQAQFILTHEPGKETLVATAAARAGLFETAFSPEEAKAQHSAYRTQLQAKGAQVVTVRDVLLGGCVDTRGKAIENAALRDLRALAKERLNIVADAASDISNDEIHGHRAGLIDAVNQYSPAELVTFILEGWTISLSRTAGNTGLQATYQSEPLMNLMFLRDQLITTPKGVVVGCMNSPQRAFETKVILLVLKFLNITPLWVINREGDGIAASQPCAFDQDQRPARLEGGDYIPAGEVAFIGHGLRTSAAGIRQLLNGENILGSQRVVVVHDAWWNQDQMHLDTYFNIAARTPEGRTTAVMVDTRFPDAPKRDANHMRVTCDVWLKQANGSYALEQKDLDFYDYVTGALNYDLIKVPAADQLKYGCNFLTVGNGQVIGVDGVSDAYKATLKAAGLNVLWQPMRALTSAYGAAHCMTQVFKRAEKAVGSAIPALQGADARAAQVAAELYASPFGSSRPRCYSI